jgi:transmembrane sensor
MSDHPIDATGSLNEEALAWVVLLTSGAATHDDAEALRMWRRRSPAHEAAFRSAARVWRRSGEAALAAAVVDAAVVGRVRLRASVGRRRALIAGTTLAVGAVGVIFAGMRFGYLPPVGGLLADHRTGTGEQKRVVLADASVVELNTRTSVRVRFTASERRIELIEGEASFSVASDSQRPFIVAASEGETTAAGTVFAVRQLDDVVRVVCLEGSVIVAAGRRAHLGPGERITYDDRGVVAMARVDGEAETAWRRGMLVFRDQPLSGVIAEINRYRRGRVWLGAAAVGQRKVSGVFHLDRPDEALAHIERTQGLRATALPAGLVILR